MITKRFTVTELAPGHSAIQVAAWCYKQWMGEVNFEQDVTEYLEHGCVVSQPNLFAMAKMIALPSGERAWFIRMAVGPLDKLLECLPCYLPKICFCRRGDQRVREYSLDRLAAIAKGKKREG